MKGSASKTTIFVEGMTCVSCVAHVEGALTDLPGVIQADVLLRENRVIVQYNGEQVNQADMAQAVIAAGYRVAGLKQPRKDQRSAGGDRRLLVFGHALLFVAVLAGLISFLSP